MTLLRANISAQPDQEAFSRYIQQATVLEAFVDELKKSLPDTALADIANVKQDVEAFHQNYVDFLNSYGKSNKKTQEKPST